MWKTTLLDRYFRTLILILYEGESEMKIEKLLKPIYQDCISDVNTLGILLIEKTKSNSRVTDKFDVILLIITLEGEHVWKERHFEYADKTVAFHIVTHQHLMTCIDTNRYSHAVEWVTYGKKIVDKEDYLGKLKMELRRYPEDKRDLRKIIEFGKLVKIYRETKELYELDEYMDAYSKMIDTLKCLSRLEIIDKGYYPEIIRWSQVKQIDLEVYKLYEECINSQEAIEKRVGLMLLATNYVIGKRMKGSARYLLKIMETRSVPWMYSEISKHVGIQPYEIDLTVVLSYLVEKDILISIKQETEVRGVYIRTYLKY